MHSFNVFMLLAVLCIGYISSGKYKIIFYSYYTSFEPILFSTIDHCLVFIFMFLDYQYLTTYLLAKLGKQVNRYLGNYLAKHNYYKT